MNEADDRRTTSAQVSMRSQIKRLARKVAAFGYRLVRPVARPILYRTRTFVAAPQLAEIDALRRDVLYEIRHTHAVAMAVLTQTAQSVQHDVIEGANRENRSLAAGVHQSIQFSRESLREDLFRTHTAASLGLNKESNAIVAALDAVTDVMRAEASRLHSVAIERDAFARLDKSAKLAGGRRAAAPCADGVLLVKSEAGYVFCPDQDHAALTHLLATGDMTKGTRLVIQRLIGPGDVFIDVDAHLGVNTLAAARGMRGDGKVIAFDRSALNRLLLSKSVAMNGFTTRVDVSEKSPLSRDSWASHKVSLLAIDALDHGSEFIDDARQCIEANVDVALMVKIHPSALHSTQATFSAMRLLSRMIDPGTGELKIALPDSSEPAEDIHLLAARAESSAWGKLGVKHD